jgi:hypothetical protein
VLVALEEEGVHVVDGISGHVVRVRNDGSLVHGAIASHCSRRSGVEGRGLGGGRGEEETTTKKKNDANEDDDWC